MIQNIKVNESLEARQVAIFVQTASSYSGDIYIKTADKTINAKSIMGVLALGISKGDHFAISTENMDALQALVNLQNFFTAV